LIVELGHLALILALALAIVLGTLPLVGAALGREQWMRSAYSLTPGLFVLVALSFGCLAYAFLTDDFSVSYVARNSNSLLPDRYKFSALWGAHEGSFLLWILIMAAWTLGVAWFGRRLPLEFSSRVLAVMGLLSVGFIAFALLTSNPFERTLPLAPAEGSDLNPVLQDFGLIVHPPILYAGYVGFSVAFSFAIVALMSGRLDAAWARWSRPWTNAAWAFLTVGIALGSWWAYYELGWGGWWFWDPVENASFMPWLVGTALVHSLAVTEKRGVFKSWTVLLAIAAFSFSLLGAFIVRSGVLTSVHAFAVDPLRGVFILAFLLLVVGGSLALYAVRAPMIRSRAGFSGLSREVVLLINNLVLVVALAVVLLGTLYPLAYEAVTGGAKISVGPPYFNSMFVPLMALLALVLGLAPVARWKRTGLRLYLSRLSWVFLASVVLGVVLPLLFGGELRLSVTVAAALALWIVISHLTDAWRRAGSLAGLFGLPVAYVGMLMAHLGFAMCLLGVTVTSQLSVERDQRVVPGDEITLGPLQLTFVGVSQSQGPNYVADVGRVRVVGDGEAYELRPERRRYQSGGNVMTEAAIAGGFFKDVFVALGEPLGDGAWALRTQYKPLVRWVWFGALLMGMGGVCAVLDPRYRRLRERRRVVASDVAEVPV